MNFFHTENFPYALTIFKMSFCTVTITLTNCKHVKKGSVQYKWTKKFLANNTANKGTTENSGN